MALIHYCCSLPATPHPPPTPPTRIHTPTTTTTTIAQVFACQAAVSAAEDHLQQLLPQLASTAGVASLSYVSILNQGNYLVELPAARTKVPKGWDKVM